MTEFVEIIDVAPRDGLQSQPKLLDTKTKLEFIGRLIDAGVRRMEIASFVNPKRVPQMADVDELIQGLPDHEEVTYIGLVLNKRGYERAIASGIDEINCVVLASDTFNQRNQGATTEQTMASIKGITSQARNEGLACGVTIGAAFGCPFEGEVPVSRVVDLAARLTQLGVKEIALADTIGVAGPSDVTRVIRAVSRVCGDARLRCHFHNTRNTGVANAYVAIQEGIRTLDTSCGGVGGCPFAPAATGNVATEDVLYMLQRMAVETGIDINKIMQTARWLEGPLQTEMPAMVTRAGLFPPEKANIPA
ncbi:MAG: hydroxymethylglutaryl-CoA lyase [Gammaproteobacteria bacterium]